MKVQSIERVFDILELLSAEHEGVSLTVISQRLELPTSTVFRLLSVLRNRNYVEKNEATGLYRLGLGFVELTSLYLSNIELKTEAQPYLRSLSVQTGQVVFMGTEQDGELVYIDKYEQFNEIRKYCFIGQRRPLYSTALGKALLTSFTDEQVRELYRDRELEPQGPNTITDVDTLIAEVHETCRRGYATDNEEMEPGMRCVAAPVYDYRGVVIAAVSTSWDLDSHQDADPERNIRLVRRTAMDISIRMGFRPEKQTILCSERESAGEAEEAAGGAAAGRGAG